ncbi:MAG: NAD(P)/FAD-dependent oxidoreductase [Terriglobia bacterium]
MDQGAIKTEVLVAGGGPAGLAAAIAIRLKGFEVTLADPAQPPIDKACGEGIMPAGVAALRQLGVVITAADSQPFRGICFRGCEAAVAADFPRDCGLGVRRTALHRLLSQRAAELGVSMLWNTRVMSTASKAVSINGQPIHCKWLIAADGQNSSLRRWAGLDSACQRGERRFAFRRHFRANPWSDYVEVHWGKASQVFVTPVGPDEVCVSLMSQNAHTRLESEIPKFLYLAGRLKGSLPTSPERGSLSANLTAPAVIRDGIALVGDASGSIDAISGEGLCFAFQQAICLAEALAQNNPAYYQEAHRRITGFSSVMASLMVAMGKHSLIRRRVLRGLSSEPRIFDRLLALHVGALTPGDFGMRGVFDLGWRVLTA